MKLLIIASAGDCPLALAMRAKADGHKVRVFIRNNNDGSRNDSGDGIVINDGVDSGSGSKNRLSSNTDEALATSMTNMCGHVQ